MPTIEYGNLTLDENALNIDKLVTRAHNCSGAARGYKAIYSSQAVTPALDTECLGAISVISNALVPYVYAGDAAKLYEVTVSAATDRSGSAYTLTGTESWEFTKFGENVIAVSRGENPQTITIGGAAFADLGGTPPKASAVATVRDFVVLGDINDGTAYPARIHWSAFNDSTGWTVGVSQSDVQDLFGNGGRIQRIIGGEYGVIFQERAIWRMAYEGEPTVFRFDKVEDSRGTLAKYSCVKVGDMIFYLSQDGFYQFNGSQSQAIGEGSVDEYFFSTVDRSRLWRMHGADDPVNKRIVWSYPTGEGTPDAALIYDYMNSKWTTADYTSEYLLEAVTVGYTLDGLDSISGSLDDLPASLDSALWAGGDYVLAHFDEEHKLAYFTGAAKQAVIETAELQPNPSGTAIFKMARPLNDGVNSVQVGTRDKLIDNITWSPSVTANAIGEHDFLVDARYHRVRTTIDTFTRAFGVEVDIGSTGSR